MRKISLFLMIWLWLTIFFINTASAEEVVKKGDRIIRVCILNDIIRPVPEEKIFQITDAVFQEYKQKFGIIFVAEGSILSYKHQIVDEYTLEESEKVVEALCEICPKNTEIRLIFTDQIALTTRGPAGPNTGVFLLYGRTFPNGGVVILYQVKYKFKYKNAAGQSQVINIFKHELAHLFGVEHSTDKKSLMCPTSVSSLGEWDEATINVILNNKDKKWYSPAP